MSHPGVPGPPGAQRVVGVASVGEIEALLPLALDVARGSGAGIHLVLAAAVDDPVMAELARVGQRGAHVLRGYPATLDARLRARLRELGAAEATVEVGAGPPGAAVRSAAGRLDAELIVVGSANGVRLRYSSITAARIPRFPLGKRLSQLVATPTSARV